MAKLVWDAPGTHLYETGVDHGVLYTLDANKAYTIAEVWNGLTSVTASPSGAEETKLWADNINYASLRSAESFGGTIEAYTYPNNFMACDGTASPVAGLYIGQQPRSMFGLAYRTLVGNEVDLNDHGYKLHLIYGATCSPSQKQYSTVNDSPEAISFSWEFTTTPVSFSVGNTTYKPTAEIVIDSTKFPKQPNGDPNAKLAALEDKLFGSTNTSAYLPLPAEVISTLS